MSKAILYVLISLCSIKLYEVSLAKLGRSVEPLLGAVFVSTASLGIALLLFFTLGGSRALAAVNLQSIAVNKEMLLWACAAGAAAFCIDYFRIASFAEGGYTTIAIITIAASVVLSLIFGAFLFRETLTIHYLIGAGLMLAGAVVIALR